MGMMPELSIDLLDEKSVCLLSDAQLNRLITVLTNARDHRKEEAKNKAILDFYNAWSKLRELGITPHYFSKENVYYDDDDDVYRIDLNNFEEFTF